MIVSDSRRLLFVHVQKTGGLTVQAALTDALEDARQPKDVPDGRHTTYSDAVALHPEWREHFSFGFVRNPWARMWSWHSMVMRRKAAAEAGNESVLRQMTISDFWGTVSTEMTDFETFVMEGPEAFVRLRTPQLHYLRDGDDRVDFVGRTEHLADDLDEVFARFDLPKPVREQRNAGPPSDYRPHFTPQMREQVAAVFAEDIEAFGYTF